jgi:hypothetical protein
MAKSLLAPRYVGLALGVAFLLACFPGGLEAAMVGSMPSGQQDLTPRQAKEAQVSRLLGEERVAAALGALGLTGDQVRSRLDRLNDQQLGELTRSLETVKAGGDPVLALTFVAVILLGVLIYMQIEAA